MQDNHRVRILLVDDDEIAVESIQRALRKHGITNPVSVTRDGLEALAALRGEGGVQRIPRPYLILLDLSMPRMNGIEFLGEMRRDPRLHDSIVLVLTTSADSQDQRAAYKRHVAGYLVKSKVGGSFLHMTRLLDSYLRIVDFPL